MFIPCCLKSSAWLCNVPGTNSLSPCQLRSFARKDVIMIIITNTTGVKYLDTNNIYTNLRASNWKYTAQAPRVLGFRKLMRRPAVILHVTNGFPAERCVARQGNEIWKYQLPMPLWKWFVDLSCLSTYLLEPSDWSLCQMFRGGLKVRRSIPVLDTLLQMKSSVDLSVEEP